MLRIILARLALWRAYRKTYQRLQGLDRTLLADVGLADLDLREVSRTAARHGGTIPLYQIVRAYYGEDIRKPVKFALRSAGRHTPAETCSEGRKEAA
ncbi:DUF1127 domain-containing protein [Pelagibacterium xiamenense]|uniref:DUF1127 domain-containing protein n=1 Tax=Pelagibacterium xiamenense TaxID=2901140 RepID=UPI001E28B0AD|nr:hypothetical protein [Pelagibacterium xiamenense]MCD7058716.1 hypothetical protein [Pelagibacterium xiamenense]